MEENREELLEQLMPKLTALSERLEDMGIENDVLMAMESLPAVLAEVEGRQLQLACVPVAEGGYLLSITAALEIPEEDEENLVERCCRFNENSLLAMACLDPFRNQVIFKCAVPEAEEGWDSRILTFALEALAADIRRYESQG